MTRDQIIELAREAAQAAFDAHAPADLPSAVTAYDFIRQTRYEDFEGSDEDAQALWDSLALRPDEWEQLTHAYRQRIAELIAACETDSAEDIRQRLSSEMEASR